MQREDEFIDRRDLFLARTPTDLQQYRKDIHAQLEANSEWRKAARAKSGIFKRYVEELIPFSHFCSWKYADRADVWCRLVDGTVGGDCIVVEGEPPQEHCVEITWPIDGKWDARQRQLVNETGCSEVEVWDIDDVTLQSAAVKRVIQAAKKKARRDYRAPGGSTLIFVLDMTLFWSDFPQHRDLFARLRQELSHIPMLVDEVLLMTFFGEEVKIFPVPGNRFNVSRLGIAPQRM